MFLFSFLYLISLKLFLLLLWFVFASVEFSFRNDNIYFSWRTLLTLFKGDNFFKKKMSCVYEKNHSFRNIIFFFRNNYNWRCKLCFFPFHMLLQMFCIIICVRIIIFPHRKGKKTVPLCFEKMCSVLIKRKVGITSLVKVALSHVWEERQKLQGEVNYVDIFNLYIYKIHIVVKIYFSFHI